MQDSHTAASAAETTADPGSLRLVGAGAAGLPQWLAGRVDEHLAEFAAHMTQGLLAASTAVGLEVMAELMDVEVVELAGPKGKHDPARVAMRHGSQPGTVALGGRQLGIRRPRIRTTGADAHELALESYSVFASTDLLAEGIVARMLAGLSTRRYTAGLEPVGPQVEQAASGTSKSAISHRFVQATAERLAQLLARRLDQERWLVVFLDGFGMGEHRLVGALGVTADGTKVPLGVAEGTTENKAVCTRLVADLADRGLDASRGGAVRRRRRQGPGAGDPQCVRPKGAHPEVPSAQGPIMSPTTCPRRSGPWSSGGCAPPGPTPTLTRPRPSWNSWPAALTASGPVPPPPCARAWPRP